MGDCDSWGRNVCQTSSNACQECNSDADCSGGTFCREDNDGDKTCESKCTTDSDCQTGSDKNYKCKDTYCVHGMSGCDWTDKDSDEVGKKLIAGNVVGIVIGILAVVAVSLPLCCGFMKNSKAGSCEMTKLIAAIVLFVGIFVILIPLIGTSSATEGAID